MLPQVSVAPTQAQGELLKCFWLEKEYFSVQPIKEKKKADSSLFIPDRKGLKKPNTPPWDEGTLLASANKPSPGNSRERGVFPSPHSKLGLPVSGGDLESSEDGAGGEKTTLFLRNVSVFKETL